MEPRDGYDDHVHFARHSRTYLTSMYIRLIIMLALVPLHALPAGAGGARQSAETSAGAVRDGAHDFDWEIGTWDTKLKLRAPLSGSRDWREYTGTTVVTPLLGKRANVVELDVKGAAGRIAGVSLRLYQPAGGQWTLNFANVADGGMTEPMSGSFRQGQGTFYGQDTVRSRKVFVRFLIIREDEGQWRFEQAYSDDGGKNWETNWIAVDTRRE
jgi:hypothetical protein